MNTWTVHIFKGEDFLASIPVQATYIEDAIPEARKLLELDTLFKDIPGSEEISMEVDDNDIGEPSEEYKAWYTEWIANWKREVEELKRMMELK